MSSQGQRIVIIGATSAIAEHCARLWATRAPSAFVLVGRDTERVERVAADLRVRSPRSVVENIQVDFTDPGAIGQLADDIVRGGDVDIVLIAHGSLPDQQRCQQDPAYCDDALVVNGISPVLFAEAFAGHMQRAGKGRLAVIGSVAGDRGRKSNYVYGAAKGLVDRYMQGLQHRLAATGANAILIKPGPTDTPMAAWMKEQGRRLADVNQVARQTVAGIDKGRAVVYTPRAWALIMLVIRHLPGFVFNRIDI